jgi:hypothetical protein
LEEALLLGEDCHGLGVVARYRLSRPCVVGLVVKPVGKPDAGDPHVRFDEREEETEPWRGLRHRHLAKAAGQQLFPTPSATASLLDSTFADDLSVDALSGHSLAISARRKRP